MKLQDESSDETTYVPEYTAYSSMLAAFRRLLPVPTSLSSQDKYKLHVPELENTIKWVYYHETRWNPVLEPIVLTCPLYLLLGHWELV